jgi:S-DNA-T family DNA segregation ATPase FtsK/SpoIIIE
MTPEQALGVIVARALDLGLDVEPALPIDEGPVLRTFRLVPKGKTTVAQLCARSADFAVALGVEDVMVRRVGASSSVRVFVPREDRAKLLWRDYVGKADYTMQVPLLLGIDVAGNVVNEDLAALPHLLIAGSTGSGKSTLLRSILATLAFGRPSSNVQFLISDAKGVDFRPFIGAPHLVLGDVASSPQDCLEQTNILLEEMTTRLKVLAEDSFTNIAQYNEVSTDPLPWIILVIDELADPYRAEFSRRLNLLASKARATGIHIIASTQRPSAKLIDGDIKANFPARLSFRLPTEADSRTVLGSSGAEHLLSRGDCLYISPYWPSAIRLHTTLASEEDIKSCIELAVRRLVG